MKLFTLKCPHCEGKLKVESMDQATCIHCGYNFIIEKEQAQIHSHYYNVPAKPVPVSNHPGRGTQAMGIIITVLTLAIFAVGFLIKVIPIFTNGGKGLPAQSAPAAREYRTAPESAPFNAFLSFAFNKPAAAVQADELATIKYIDVKYNDDMVNDLEQWEFSYSFEDYTAYAPEEFQNYIYTFSFAAPKPNDTEQKLIEGDIETFTGLLYLNLNDEFHSKGISFAPLKNLRALYGAANLVSEENLFVEMDKMRELEVRFYKDEDVEDLLNFPNLEKLKIIYINEETTDMAPVAKLQSLRSLDVDTSKIGLSWLSTLPNLTELTVSMYDIADFSSLYSLTKLEKLTMDSAYSVKSIDFVKNMPGLKQLTIINCSVLTLEPLRDKASLTSLEIDFSESDVDLSAISTLTSLKKLHMQRGGGKTPDISGLAFLEDVKITESYLKTLRRDVVKKLYLYSNDDFDFNTLAGFTQLEELTLATYAHDCYNYSALNNLTNLKKLVLSAKLNYFIRIDELFRLEHIESLSLYNVYLEGRSKGIHNTALKELALYETKYFEETTITYYEIGISEEMNQLFTGCLPALERLELPEVKLSNIDFVTNMPALKFLDITNNYVTDIAPLAAHEAFELLLCRDNPIVNYDIVPERVSIIK